MIRPSRFAMIAAAFVATTAHAQTATYPQQREIDANTRVARELNLKVE